MSTPARFTALDNGWNGATAWFQAHQLATIAVGVALVVIIVAVVVALVRCLRKRRNERRAFQVVRKTAAALHSHHSRAGPRMA